MKKTPKTTIETLKKKNRQLAEKNRKLETLIEDIKTARLWSEDKLKEQLGTIEKINNALEEKNLFLQKLINISKVTRELQKKRPETPPGKVSPPEKKEPAEEDTRKAEQELEKAFQKQKELERIISDSPAVVFLWRAVEGWPIEFVSDNIRQFGYRPEDFYFKRIHYASIVHPDDLERMVAEVNRYNQQGDDSFIQKYRIVTKAGDVRWLEDHTWVRRADDGTISHYQGILMDITDRKEAAEALLQAEKMAAIGTMAASVAHELRSPLGVIKLAVDNINYRMKKKDEKVAMSLSYIDQKVAEAAKIINDLLNYSRLGKPVLAATDINALVEEALSTVRVDFRDRDVKVTQKFGKIPEVSVDLLQIKGVLQNIIKNAYEAMEKGGKLLISTKYDKTEKKTAISIADTGCGIAEEDIGKLNKPFYSTKVKGVGLGLALSFRIVKENHRGEISVKSKPGKGTTFTVKLPE